MGRRQELPTQQTRFGTAPSHWAVMTLAECAYVQTGIAKGRKLDSVDVIHVPYLRVANVQDGYLDLSEMKYIDIRKSEAQRYSLKTGDILLTEGGDFDKLGRGFIWGGQIANCVHQNHIFAVRVNRDLIHPEFLGYLIQSTYGKSYFLSVAHKTTNLACINTSKLKAFPVLIPPLPEQRAIAHVLRTVQQAKEATEKVIAAARQLKQSLMRHLFTYGPVPFDQADQVELKETPFGMVPEPWTMVSPEVLFKLSSGETRPAEMQEHEADDYPYPVFGGNGVMGYAREYLTSVPTIVLGRVGAYCGVVHIAPPRSWISDNALYTKHLHQDFNLRFVAASLEILDLNRFQKKSGQPLITQSIVNSQQVPLPSRAAQDEIIKMIVAAQHKEEIEARRSGTLDALFNSLLHNLMTGKVRVHDLVVPEPAETTP